jgi:ABC-type molybdate transport system substrate-binding protein
LSREGREPFMKSLSAIFAAALIAVSVIPSAASAADKTVLTILVGSLAKEPVEEIIPLYEKSHPTVTIQAQYAGGSVLIGEVAGGVSADMVLSNNQSFSPVAAKLGTMVPIFRIHEAVIVPKGSTKVKTLRDLASPGIHVGMVTANAPAGQYARGVLKAAGATYGADFESKVLANVTASKTSDGAVVELVASGSLDAAIGHPTDASGKIDVIAIPAAFDIPASDAVASAVPIKATTHLGEVNDFIAFLAGKEAQAVFVKHHFDVNTK